MKTETLNANLAEIANGLAAKARHGGHGGAPQLSGDSTREDVIRWLQWNDPNGSHTDELARRDDLDPYTEETAWEALSEMLEVA